MPGATAVLLVGCVEVADQQGVTHEFAVLDGASRTPNVAETVISSFGKMESFESS